MQGIGDSGQGFFNAILFVAFTPSVRKQFFSCACFKCRRQNKFDPKEKSMYSTHETQHLFTKAKSISFNRKYSSVPQEEMVHSSYQNKTISLTSDDTP